MDYSPPGSSVHGIFQARLLERVAISFSRGSSWPRNRTHISCIAGRFFTIELPGNNYIIPFFCSPSQQNAPKVVYTSVFTYFLIFSSKPSILKLLPLAHHWTPAHPCCWWVPAILLGSSDSNHLELVQTLQVKGSVLQKTAAGPGLPRPPAPLTD